jgi:5-methylthioribose kinase
MIISLPRRKVDETIDAYVDWREECTHVREAYRRWLSAEGADVALAFRAYVAALDREERASEVYADLMGRLGHLLADAPPKVTGNQAPTSGASQQ